MYFLVFLIQIKNSDKANKGILIREARFQNDAVLLGGAAIFA